MSATRRIAGYGKKTYCGWLRQRYACIVDPVTYCCMLTLRDEPNSRFHGHHILRVRCIMKSVICHEFQTSLWRLSNFIINF